MRTEWDVDDPFRHMWFSPQSQHTLAFYARSTSRLQGDVVEVGSWTGRSTCALANAVYPTVVRAVDTWEGSPGEVSAVLATDFDVYTQFLENVAAFTKGNVHSFRMDWREYFTEHARPIRFLFIDATHTYEEVRDNIAAASPLMVDGAVMCGDDFHDPQVGVAVREAFPDAFPVGNMWVQRL